jgi:mono/diheme cytochrome c family protein
MNKQTRHIIRFAAFAIWTILALAMSAKSGRTLSAQDASLPDGQGVEVAKSSCLSCHGPELIVQQKLPRSKWQGEVEKMQRWGAEVSDDQKNSLIDYLTAHFGDHPMVAARQPGGLPDGDGVEVAKESCLSCHGPELITQQRLTGNQWTAEVEKMIRWGAEVSADDKQSLINYLAKGFPSKN